MLDMSGVNVTKMCHTNAANVTTQSLKEDLTFRKRELSQMSSKHLKGQLDPLLVTVTFFASKEVSWTPLLVTVTFFASKEVSWTPLLVTVTFLHQRRSVGTLY